MWVSLTHRAKLIPEETVLILGATGVTGQLAVQLAKVLGAKRVIGAGRNEQMLSRLRDLGGYDPTRPAPGLPEESFHARGWRRRLRCDPRLRVGPPDRGTPGGNYKVGVRSGNKGNPPRTGGRKCRTKDLTSSGDLAQYRADDPRHGWNTFSRSLGGRHTRGNDTRRARRVAHRDRASAPSEYRAGLATQRAIRLW
jgi:hypothetical protein